MVDIYGGKCVVIIIMTESGYRSSRQSCLHFILCSSPWEKPKMSLGLSQFFAASYPKTRNG